MRHRVDHRKLGRPTDQRLAILRSLVKSLLLHGKVETTVDRAKEARRVAEKVISRGREDSVHARRQALRLLNDPGLVKHLFEEVAPQYKDRPGGYTQIVRTRVRRGDGAQLAVLRLVE